MITVGIIARNTTERKHAEDALKRNEANLNRAQQVAHVGSWYLNAPENVLEWSAETYRMFGIAEGTPLTSEDFMACVHSEDREHVDRSWQAALDGKPYDIEHRVVVKGEVKWVHERADLEFDSKGNVEAAIGTVQDITESKRAEEALRRRAEELAALQATVLEITASHDLPSLLQAIVERAALLLHAQGGGLYLCDPDQQEARCVVSYNTPRDYTGTALKYGEGAAGIVAQSGEPLIIDDYRTWSRRAAVYEDEQPFTAVLSTPMIWQGQVIGVIDILHDVESRRFAEADLELLTLFANHAAIAVENARLYEQARKEITERKHAEEALRRSEANYRELTDSITDVFFGFDKGLRYTYWNKASEKLTGIPAKDAIGKFLYELFPDTTETRRAERVYLDVLRTQQSQSFVNEYQHGGKNYFFEISVYPSMGGLSVFVKDITERKRVEDALRFTRFSIDNAPDTMVCIDRGGRYIDVNDALCRSVGYSREELLSMTAHDIDPNYSAEIWPEFWKKLKQNGSLTFESCHRTKEGKVFPVEISANFFEYNGKEYHCGFARDITERKRAEEALRVSLEKYRVLFESFPLGITISDKSGEIIEVNRQSEQLLGITREAHAQRRIDGKEWQIIRKDGTPMPVDEYASTRALRENRLIENVEMGIVKDKGEITWINVTAAPIPLEGYGVAIAYGDITERKRTEEALIESEERYRFLFKNMLNGYAFSKILVDEENKPVDFIYIDVNDAFEKLTGLRKEDVIGKRITEAIPSIKDLNPELISIYGEVASTGKPTAFEVCFKPLDIWLAISVYSPHKGYFVAIFDNITERKRAEEAIRESEEKFRVLIEAAGRVGEGIIIIQESEEEEAAFVFVNDQFCRMSGYSREELLGRSTWDLVPHEISVRLRDLYKRRHMGESVPGHYEAAGIRKDGAIVPLELSTAILPWQGKTATALYLRDITERKRAEDQILRQGAVLDGISKVFREALICKTEEELSSKSLSVAQELTGSKFGWIGEINQKGRLDTIALSDPGWNECRMSKSDARIMLKDMEVRGFWGQVLKEEQSLIVNDPHSHPYSVGTPEGHPPITAFLGVPLKHTGKTFGMIALANKESGYDLPDQEAVETLSVAIVEALERKRAEEALKESERRYRSLFDGVPVGLYRTTSAGQIIEANPALVQMLGYPDRESFLAINVADTYADPEDRIQWQNLTGREGVVRNFEAQLRRRDGTTIWVEENNRAVRDAEGCVLCYEGSMTDITERKRAEEQLKSSTEQLRALSAHLQSIREEERTLIAREIHDELGQELTGLKMDLSWVKKKLPKKEKTLVEKTQSMLKFIDTTIQSVRKISTELRPGILDDLGLIAAIEWQAQDFENRTEIKCDFNSSPEEIDLDRDLSTAVFRIFQETLTNVSRHTKATRVKINLERDADTLILRMEDNGKGIKESEVFHPKSLGLLGMRERALLFGGDVKISGVTGKGTTVTVSIPINKEKKAESRMQ